MASSTLPGLPTSLTAANNAATDLFYTTIDPFGTTDDRKQDRTNLFAQIPVPVGLGKPGTVQGNLLFYNANNSNAVTFRADTPAAALTYVLPNASPTVGQVLSASAPASNIVTLSWATVAATPGGSTTQLQYNNAGAFGGISGATTDGTNTTFGSTNLRATSPRITTGILDSNGLSIILLTATASAVNEITLANSTTTNPVTLSTTGGDASVGLTITTKGTGITTITGNAIINAGTGATTIGEASLGAEQLRLTSVSASRVALSVNSLANSTVDLIQAVENRSNTNTVANLATLTTNSNGTAAAGFGHSITHQLESSTTDSQVAGIESIRWKVATHASRSSIWALSTVSAAITQERLLIAPSFTLTDNTAVTILTLTVAANSVAGCTVFVTVNANDGTDYQAITTTITFAVVNKAGTLTATVTQAGSSNAVSAGTLTLAATAGAGANANQLQLNANSSLTANVEILYTVLNHTTQAITLA